MQAGRTNVATGNRAGGFQDFPVGVRRHAQLSGCRREVLRELRRLWTEQTVTFSGTFDRITGAGLAPMPVQRPIPV